MSGAERPSRLQQARENPGRALEVLWSLAKGQWLKWWYPLRGIDFRAGRNFRVDGRLTIRGPGRVVFGDDVTIGMHVTPWTHAPDAVIEVGDGCFLNGTRFGCTERITLGDRVIVGEARILDTDYHSVRADRHSVEAPIRVRPVVLERNVWVGAAVGILPGTVVGENSVVGFGAVCSGRYPPDSVIAGNPARVVKSIPPIPA